MDFRWWLVFGWCFCCWLLGSVLREQLNHCIQRCGWTFADELCLQRCADAEDWHTHVNIVAGALYFLSSLFLCSFAENCEGKCQIYIYYMYWNKCKVGSCIRCMCMLHLRDSILLWLIYENSILCLCEHCYFVCCCYCYFINFFLLFFRSTCSKPMQTIEICTLSVAFLLCQWRSWYSECCMILQRIQSLEHTSYTVIRYTAYTCTALMLRSCM